MARTPLSKLDDYELVNKDQDIRGWEVQDYTGRVLGSVDDLIVDTDKESITAIVLDDQAEYSIRDIEIRDNRILLGARTASPELLKTDKAAWSDVDAKGDLRLQVVEERLRVGKRQVEQGGVRVSRQVSDRPVQTQVQLREEHVEVVRRPVDRTATAADLATMKDNTVEVLAKAEVPVVAKQARVVEEVVVKRDVKERRETVHETVRQTDVEVEEIKPRPNYDRIL